MFKKSKLALLVLVIIGIGTFGPLAINSASANVFTSPAGDIIFTPQIGIGTDGVAGAKSTKLTAKDTSYIGEYIKAIYDYGLSIVGILATIVLMVGGYLWAMSGGDATKITQAKEMITGAIVGMLILLASVTLLGRINPELVDFHINPVGTMTSINYGCCKDADKVSYVKEDKCKGTFYLGAYPNYKDNECEMTGCCIRSYGNEENTLCTQTTETMCKEIQKVETRTNKSLSSDEFNKDKSCQSIDICTDSIIDIIDCDDMEYGESGRANGIKYYCYDHVPYFGEGEKGDPCGYGSFGKGSCFDMSAQKENCPDSYKRVYGAGMDCGKGLACCSPIEN